MEGDDDKPLMITNGGLGDEPRRLGIPSGARSAPRTAGAKLRNQKNGGIVGSGGKINGGRVHGLPRPGKANGQRGEGAVLLGRIEQNKYVSERDNEKDIQRQMQQKRANRITNADYNLFNEEDANGAFVTTG